MTAFAHAGLTHHADRAAGWIVVGIGFSLPISVALDNILVALLLIAWLASAQFHAKFAAVHANPVALYAGALFLLYCIGAFYSIGDRAEVLHALDKAAVLLLIPLLVSLRPDAALRQRALRAFMAAMLVTLALSFLVWLDLLPEHRLIKGTADNPTVFKLHITHSVFMAFAAYLFALEARHATKPGLGLALAAVALLSAFNVVFMTQGRTGLLVLMALMSWLFFGWLRWRGLLAAAVALLVLGGAVYLTPGSSMHQALRTAIGEVNEWQPGEPTLASVGQRLEFYRNTLTAVRERPLFGAGTGGFEKAYAQQIAGARIVATRNPHNEYLMIAAQLGLVGLTAFVGFFWLQWRLARGLPDAGSRAVAHALVITIATASLVSSTLIDHAEGLFFAWACGLLFGGLHRTAPRVQARQPNA